MGAGLGNRRDERPLPVERERGGGIAVVLVLGLVLAQELLEAGAQGGVLPWPVLS